MNCAALRPHSSAVLCLFRRGCRQGDERQHHLNLCAFDYPIALTVRGQRGIVFKGYPGTDVAGKRGQGT